MRAQVAFDVGRLREDRTLERGLVRAESVGGGEAPDGSVEVLEALVGHERRDLGAESARKRVLVHDEHPTCLAHRLRDDLPIPR